MEWSFFLVFITVTLFSTATGQNRTGPVLSSGSDLAGLYALRASLGLRARDWPRRSDPCRAWTGVGCDAGRVVALQLTGLRRTRLGRINPKFSVSGIRNLTQLASFDASFFALPGEIPPWLAGNNISRLLLRSASVTGRIPDLFWSADKLRVVDLSGNNLTGVFPTGFPANAGEDGVSFNLSKNFYYGSIPSGFGGFLFMRFGSVDLSGNYFQGMAPTGAENPNVSLGFNCFRNVPGQKSEAECRRFYSLKGMEYDGPTTPPSHKKKSNKKKYILIGAIVGGVLALLLLIGIIVLCIMRCGRRRNEESRDVSSANVTPSGVAPSITPSGATATTTVSVSTSAVGDSFPYEQLLRATAEFSEKNLIKQGHSGDLYHGVLENGAAIVVKRIDVDATRKVAYEAELDFFAKASHVRLVPLLGHCLENEKEKLIVYKYMPNGDLSNALYIKSGQDEDGLQSLDWITRLKIATGVAEALSFLHHECTPPFVHRDVQASSILLDDKFEVRLGSLSEVCIQEGEGHHNVISRFLRLSSQTSEQSAPGTPSSTCAYDVFCLGKVLLELVTGKLNISGSSNASTADFLERTLPFISIYDKDSITKIVDPSLIIDEDLLEEVWAMAIVARSCLNPKPAKRPLVRYVLKALENPLKVVREDNVGSTRSWNASLFGSWRHSSSDVAGPAAGPMLKRSSTTKSASQGSDSFGRRRSKEICPEPSDQRDSDE